ncbi:MAG: AAA family ATPase [Armatimonadetes bacterium]|nr:AAA family ATPase [Armatimonadota bacterium]
MKICHFEIQNFRKLVATRIDVADQTTLFVGANNSGKTSAMTALRLFLVHPEQFALNDFTVSHFAPLNEIGKNWLDATDAPTLNDWISLLPSLDVWLDVAGDELHYVSSVLPYLDWVGGKLGVRLRLEPKDVGELWKRFLQARKEVCETQSMIPEDSTHLKSVKLWPESLVDFIGRDMKGLFTVRTYVLDPVKLELPIDGLAKPQELPGDALPVDGTPLDGLLRVQEIGAQRGFSDEEKATGKEDDPSIFVKRKLSIQLKKYYEKHLNPFDRPSLADMGALHAIEGAQSVFDEKLEECFEKALSEVQDLGYPGVTDPEIKIMTCIRPVEGLNHDAAVQYKVVPEGDENSPHLPEHFNGLGYQNLISMIFQLMGFRDGWMRSGKANKDLTPIEPILLVLVEEPEAHLHAQVQQVFIKKAFDVLRKHELLGENAKLSTQLIVSTHSSHVAHEINFAFLRYFRRLPAGMHGSTVPISAVINLSEVFGNADDTQRFVTRYLRAQHCDLFFADAAILVEGPAERMLVPHFIRSEQFKFLNHSFVTILEIGGSHAHRLKPLIEHLGLTTLVITDLDAYNANNKTSVLPELGKDQVTTNATLKTWVPAIDNIDALLASTDARTKIMDQLFAVRVAFQTQVGATVNGDNGNSIGSTFEDALVLENVEFFRDMPGDGLARAFREAIEVSSTVSALRAALFSILHSKAKKAELALDILEAANMHNLKPPTYIAEGLAWLQDRLEQRFVAINTQAAEVTPQ